MKILLDRHITGIDIGKKSIKLVQCVCKNNTVIIKRAALIELPDNYEEDAFLDVAIDAINKNRKIIKVNLNNIALICPKGLYSSFSVRLPNMPKKELIAALEWETKKVSNLAPEDLNIDYYPNIQSESETEYLVYYAEKSKIDYIMAKFEAYGMKIKYLDVPDMAEVACFNALYSDDGTVKGFFNMGATGSRLLLVSKGSILLNRILVDNLKSLYEDFKNENFEDLTYKDILELRGFNDERAKKKLERYLNDTIFELTRSIDYFKANFKMPPPTNIFLSGGVFKIPGVFSYFKNNIPYPILLNNVLEVAGYKDEALCKYGYFFNFALGAAAR